MIHRTNANISGGWLPQLIAIDLDGTLVGADLAVSRRSALAVSRAAAAGAAIILITGRALRTLASAYAQLGAQYHTICANGAVVYDPFNDLVRECKPLEPFQIREVCQRLRSRVPDVVFAAEIEFGNRLLHQLTWPLCGHDRSAAFPVSLEELTCNQAVKLEARASGLDSESFIKLVIEVAGDLVEATQPGYHGLVEMTQRGVTKAAALATFAARLGIQAADVLAFGDMPNDISMLRWAGRSVAVANAHPDVRAAATEITASNIDDGVAVYLERLLAGYE